MLRTGLRKYEKTKRNLTLFYYTVNYNKKLSFATNSWRGLLHVLRGLGLGKVFGLRGRGRLLRSLSGLLLFLSRTATQKPFYKSTKNPEKKQYYRIACSLCAFLTSGLWFLLAKMSFKEAPTMALWNFCVRRVRFFVASSSWPFLCLRLYNTVHVTFLGLRFIRCADSHLEFKKVKV